MVHQKGRDPEQGKTRTENKTAVWRVLRQAQKDTVNPDAGLAQKEVARRARVSRPTARDCLEDLVAEGRVVARAGGYRGPNGTVCPEPPKPNWMIKPEKTRWHLTEQFFGYGNSAGRGRVRPFYGKARGYRFVPLTTGKAVLMVRTKGYGKAEEAEEWKKYEGRQSVRNLIFRTPRKLTRSYYIAAREIFVVVP